MFKMSEAAAGLCVLAAGILVCAPAVGADQSCTRVTLEPGSKAEDVKAKLKLTDKSTFAVDPVGSSMLVVCSSNAAMLPVARKRSSGWPAGGRNPMKCACFFTATGRVWRLRWIKRWRESA